MYIKIYYMFTYLLFQSFFFFNDFIFWNFFELDFSFFEIESEFQIILKDVYEYLSKDTDLGFLFFNGIYPVIIWIMDNTEELINAYVLPILLPSLQNIILYFTDWLNHSFFSKGMIFSLLFPYSTMISNNIDFNVLFFTNLESYYIFTSKEKDIFYMYIDFENWFGELVSLKYQISLWREYIHNTKLSFRKYYNIYNYIYEKNYGISFSDYCLNLQGFFRVFIPGFLGGFLYLINTINLLQLDILYSNDSYLKMYDQSFKILLMDDLYYYNDVNIYNFIFNPLQFFSRKIIIFYNILSKISIYKYIYNSIYSNLVSIMYEYIFLVNAFYKESIKVFFPCFNGIYDIYNNFIYNNYEIISSCMYDNIYIL